MSVQVCNAAGCVLSAVLSILSYTDTFRGYPAFSTSNITYDSTSVPALSQRVVVSSPYQIGVQLSGVNTGAVSPLGSDRMLRLTGWGEGMLVLNYTPAVLSSFGFYTVRATMARGPSNDYDVSGIVLHYQNASHHIRINWWSNPPRSSSSRMQIYQPGDPSYGSSARSVVALQQHGDFWTLTAGTERAMDGSVVLYVQLLDACGANVLDNSDGTLVQGSIWRVPLRATATTTGAFGLYGRVNEGM